jgi:K+-transporting ATPase ATPase B chain
MTSKTASTSSLLDWAVVRPALLESLKKLSPRAVARNPVMFVVEVGSVLVTLILIRDLVAPVPAPPRPGSRWRWHSGSGSR